MSLAGRIEGEDGAAGAVSAAAAASAAVVAGIFCAACHGAGASVVFKFFQGLWSLGSRCWRCVRKNASICLAVGRNCFGRAPVYVAESSARSPWTTLHVSSCPVVQR